MNEFESKYQEIIDAQRKFLNEYRYMECPDCGGLHPFRFSGPIRDSFPRPLDFGVKPSPHTCHGFMVKINSEIRILKKNLGLDMDL